MDELLKTFDNKVVGNISMKVVKSDKLPPSSLHSFLKVNRSIPSVYISDGELHYRHLQLVTMYLHV